MVEMAVFSSREISSQLHSLWWKAELFEDLIVNVHEKYKLQSSSLSYKHLSHLNCDIPTNIETLNFWRCIFFILIKDFFFYISDFKSFICLHHLSLIAYFSAGSFSFEVYEWLLKLFSICYLNYLAIYLSFLTLFYFWLPTLLPSSLLHFLSNKEKCIFRHLSRSFWSPFPFSKNINFFLMLRLTNYHQNHWHCGWRSVAKQRQQVLFQTF